MIRTSRQSPLDLLSAWMSGVAVLFLLVGVGGSLTPISPPVHLSFGDASSAAPVQVQEFLPPGEESPSEPPTKESSETPPAAEITIPPLPTLTPPLQPPEMTELQAPEPWVEPSPVQRPPAPQPPAESRNKPAPSAPSGPPKTSPSPVRTGKPGGTPGPPQPVPFSAAGGGSFPAPSYPSAARSARVEGTVLLLVTVESSGTPSAVEVRTSSGHAMLDNAARDHLRRNWRWPSGDSRLFLVPIKFLLK
jgi:protein TonB